MKFVMLSIVESFYLLKNLKRQRPMVPNVNFLFKFSILDGVVDNVPEWVFATSAGL